MSAIRVTVTDDQRLFRNAMVELLSQEPALELVGSTSDGESLVELVRRVPVDVALVDVEMPPGMDGIQTADEVIRVSPSTKVIILTTFAHSGYVRRAMDVGVGGFLTKDTDVSDVVATIRRIHSGQRIVDPELAALALMSGPNPLTAREREVLRLALDGVSGGEIASRLFLTAGTVKNYSSSAMQKTHAKSRFQAAKVARERGWL